MFQWHPPGIVSKVNNKFIVRSHSWGGHGHWTCHPDVRNTRAQLSKWPVDLMSGMTWKSPGAYVWMAADTRVHGALFSVFKSIYLLISRNPSPWKFCRELVSKTPYPLPPGFNPANPAQFFLPTPPPFFPYFLRVPRPKFGFFYHSPGPSDPRPFFAKSPPSPAPLTPGPPTTLSSPTWFIISKFALSEHWAMENWTDIHINHGPILIKCPSVSDSLSTGSVATWIHDSISWVFHWWLKYEM